MGVVTAKGKAARESAQKKGSTIDFKKVYIRLKDGDSVRVRLLSSEDYVEYMAHGDYNKGIYTQPCIKPAGEKCGHCDANDAKDEDWKNLYAKKRYLFAFADIDEGMVRVFDATKGQAQGIIDTIEQYAEDINDVAFTFKRTGDKKETSYGLNPILKLKPADKEKFDKFNEVAVEEELYETILQPRTRLQQIQELKKAGFPVETIFSAEEIAASEEKSQEDDSKPIESDNDNPDSVF